jgi:hypothetical protein
LPVLKVIAKILLARLRVTNESNAKIATDPLYYIAPDVHHTGLIDQTLMLRDPSTIGPENTLFSSVPQRFASSTPSHTPGGTDCSKNILILREIEITHIYRQLLLLRQLNVLNSRGRMVKIIIELHPSSSPP